VPLTRAAIAPFSAAIASAPPAVVLASTTCSRPARVMCSLSAGTAGSFVRLIRDLASVGGDCPAAFDASGHQVVAAREFPAPTPLAPQRGRLPWRLRRRDRDERAECHVGPNSFRRSPRELNAPETLLRPVAIAGEVVNRLATVEIRYPGDRVRVLG